jgi:hypothetical protein
MTSWKVGARQSPFDHRRLLEEHHPRHDDGADVGRDEIQIFGVGEGDRDRPRRHLLEVRMSQPGHQQEDELKHADRDGDALDRQIAMGEGHREQQRDDRRQRRRLRRSDQRADAGEAGKLRQQRAHARQHQRADRDPGPGRSKLLADHLRVALAADDAKPNRQFLHHVEDGDQHHLQQQEAVAPLRAALRGGDQAARVGVGEHDDDARPGDEGESSPAEARRGDGGVG